MVTEVLIENWVWLTTYGIELRITTILKDFKYYVLIVTWQRFFCELIRRRKVIDRLPDCAF
jgi:hypothetical protein